MRQNVAATELRFVSTKRARDRTSRSASPTLMRVYVECHAGYRAEETPRALRLGERRVEVVDVIDRWIGPDHRYFKLRGDDGAIYIVRYDRERDEWELTLYEQVRDPLDRSSR